MGKGWVVQVTEMEILSWGMLTSWMGIFKGLLSLVLKRADGKGGSRAERFMGWMGDKR